MTFLWWAKVDAAPLNGAGGSFFNWQNIFLSTNGGGSSPGTGHFFCVNTCSPYYNTGIYPSSAWTFYAMTIGAGGRVKIYVNGYIRMANRTTSFPAYDSRNSLNTVGGAGDVTASLSLGGFAGYLADFQYAPTEMSDLTIYNIWYNGAC